MYESTFNYQSQHACLDVIVAFLDISKAFDKVWHHGLLYMLKQNRISGNLLETLTDFLKDRRQRVVLNGQNSSWANVEVVVPQDYIIDPLLFLIYKMIYQIISRRKWSRLGQATKNSRKSFYCNQFFYIHKISNVLELFYFED